MIEVPRAAPAVASPLTQRCAVFDRTGLYRYSLGRRWDPDLPKVVFVMLNPSTADAHHDDATIRRCIALARAWGCGALDVVNLFAYRTPRPAILRRVADPVGPDNDAYLVRASRRAQLVVAAWGHHGTLLGRDRAARALLTATGRSAVYCLGTTQGGQPRHPLYLPRDTRPVPWLP